MRPESKTPLPCINDIRFARSLKKFIVKSLGFAALLILAWNAGVLAKSPSTGPDLAEPLDPAKLHQTYNAKWNETNTELLKKSVAALKAGVPKEKVEDLETELNEILKVIDNLPADSPIRKVLERAENPEVGDEKLFTDETNRLFAEFLERAANVLKPAATASDAGGQPVPVPAAKPKTAVEPSKVELPDEFGKFDVFADPTMKEKIASTLSRKFFPEGKAAKLNDFDQLVAKGDLNAAADKIVEYGQKLIASRLKPNKGFQDLVKKSGIEQSAFLAGVKKRNTDPLIKMAREILAAEGKINPDWIDVSKTVWSEFGQDFVDEINELLKEANDRYNDGKDKSVARESKSKRADRLYNDAAKLVIDQLALESENEIDAFSQSRLKSYALQAAAPMTDGTTPEPGGREGETEEPTDIDQFKSTVFSKMRLIYKELGGFGNVMGIFGLKGYLAGIIIDALVQRLDRNLTDSERAKAHGWAAELEQEFQGGTGSNRPGVVIRQPIPTSPYPQWPVPTVPYVYGRMGHKLGHHQRPVMYVMPGMGGYVVMPR